MYDRTKLRAAAARAGDTKLNGRLSAAAVGRRLGVPRNTAWRLLNGRSTPSAPLIAKVERHYGIKARHLLIRTDAA
ncbi:helix-turn-helix domain-containing protein [Streptomyces sp. NBC_01255]|uniref:helix-turn-helix transcriptional regulator n=1 Tax=Streptomyces sp. NBC_01255 TaxID=2903798 RepID=UPI002E2F9FC2|nr:helix-turn-helix transcriptional regulator [Streptomyces sp. NBC_01255]